MIIKSFLLCGLVTTAIASMDLSAKVHQANVVIDVNQITSTQNPLFYGGNNIYPKGGQGLMNVKTGAFDKQTIEIASQLGLQTYRFPGGSEGNLYHWKRGIGPVDKRIDNVSGNNQGNQSNEFGSDEFGRLLETSSFTQGVIMVPYGYEKPDDAADWVEYMNSPVGENPNGGKDWAKVRANNGHPEPYNIRYWEIGNEVYGNWELNWGSYPLKGDARRGAANVEFDSVSGKAGILAFGSADRYIFGGSKYFQQQKAASKSSWKDKHIKTNGQANQKLYVKFAPVSLADKTQPFQVQINGETWQRVDSFKHSTKNSLHYTVEPIEGVIQFGDGTKGKIPEKNNFVIVDYLSGKQPGFIEYYEKMKAVDPSITIISCFEKESFYQLMAKASKPFDGVVKHYYPRGPKKSFNNDYYKSSVAKALRIAKPIKEHFHWLEKYPNSSLSGNEKIWLTEYDIKNHIDQQVILHTIINDYPHQVGSLLGHSLFLNNNTPMINDDGIVRSRALPIQIFSQFSESNFVKTSLTVSHYSYKKQNIPRLITTASINDDKSAVSVILTNTSPTQSINADIEVKGVDIKTMSRAEIWLLASDTNKPLADNNGKHPKNIYISKIADLTASQALSLKLNKASVYVVKWFKK